jgi:LysM repeat protein
MSNRNSAQKIISSYRRRQQMGPYLIGGLAIILIIVGILAVVLWITGSKKPATSLFSRPTVTPTVTSTNTSTPETPTATITVSPTITTTVTVTITATANAPFEYVVQEGDTCFGIAQKYKVNLDVLVALNPNYGATCSIKPGDKLIVPLPNQKLPTTTALPTNLAKGTKIKYTVVSGDTLGGIAERFNSTVEAIVAENKLTNVNAINAGDVLTIPVNIITPVPTKVLQTPTLGTAKPTTVVKASATATKKP